MIADELKKSILQLASEGKLYNESVGNVSEELKSILLDKKDNKKYKYIPIIDYPFTVPSNWILVKLEDVCLKITDGTHSTPKYTNSGIPFISVKDVSSGYISFENTKYISEEEHRTLYARCNPKKGDLLITKVGTTGVPAIVENDEEFSLFVSVALLKINVNKIYNRYLYYILQSPVVQKQVKDNTRGVGNKNWVLDAIKTTIIPLPPINIQKKIVEKIDLLFQKIDDIKPIENELSIIKENISKDMVKSILYSAYSGILSLSSTIENWKESELFKIADIYTGNSIPESIKKSKYMHIKEGYNYIGTKDLEFNHEFVYENGIKIPFDEPNFKYADENDILMCIEGGSAGKKIGILSEKVCFGNKLCKFSVISSDVLPRFLYYYLQSPVFLKNFYDNLNGIIGGVSVNKIKNIIIRYPSIEEQQRIIDRIEQLLPLCNDVEKLVNS